MPEHLDPQRVMLEELAIAGYTDLQQQTETEDLSLPERTMRLPRRLSGLRSFGVAALSLVSVASLTGRANPSEGVSHHSKSSVPAASAKPWYRAAAGCTSGNDPGVEFEVFGLSSSDDDISVEVGALGGYFQAEGSTFETFVGSLEQSGPQEIDVYAGGSLVSPGHRTVSLPKTCPVSSFVGMAPTPNGEGYWLLKNNPLTSKAADFNMVEPFGDAKNNGEMTNTHSLFYPLVDMAPTPNGEGYWLEASDGVVSKFGNAKNYGSAGEYLVQSDFVGMAPTPNGEGYWQVTRYGVVSKFGNAELYDTQKIPSGTDDVIGIESTPSGEGYWLFSSTGEVWSEGDAKWYGSIEDSPLVDMAPTSNGEGYWLATSTGHIYQRGDAKFYGSPAHSRIKLSAPIVSIKSTPNGEGYWALDGNGKVYPFGNAKDYGPVTLRPRT
ncbi:MAG TPA: hypothetical protein VMR18_04695 [Candidatus Saccharimonadales bacterium]|nr:hypothetical protein [Candidatus Saccharimonadales bacterium]